MKPRQVAYEILKKVMIEQQYANLLMRQYSSNEITPFVTEVVYGVLRNFDYLSNQWVVYTQERPKMDIAIALNIIVYELMFLEHKVYAAVNEGVELVKKGQRPFVNALMHKVMDHGFIDTTDIALRYSIPNWIYRLWLSHYGEKIAFDLCVASNHKQPIYYHLNTLLANRSDLNELNTSFINDFCFTSNENLVGSPLYQSGFFYIQDYGASKIVGHLELEPHLYILDMCAAPGTKSAQMAILTNDNATIDAMDIHQHRVQLIEQGMKRLGIHSVHVNCSDGLIYNADAVESYDRILLDVPCSGLGVLARKPDIKWRITTENIDEITRIQAGLLNNACHYLKVGGLMVYSTCTLNKKENERQIQQFLKQHPFMELINEETIWPFDTNSDGFYIAKLLKNAENVLK